MLKLIVLVFFSSMLVAQESSGLSQRLESIDVEQNSLLSSFDTIKKEHEAQEIEAERERNNKIEQEEKAAIVLAEKNRIESESVQEAERQNALREATQAQEMQKAEALIEADELQKNEVHKKAKVHNAKKKKKIKQKKKRKQNIKTQQKSKKQEKTTLTPKPTPLPKKRSTQEHLDSVLKG